MSLSDITHLLFLSLEDANDKKTTMSPEYVTLAEKWKFFLQQNDENEKIIAFQDFCSFYSKILKNESTLEISMKVTPKISNELFKHHELFRENPDIMIKCVKILSIAFQYAPLTKINEDFLNFFFSFLDCSRKADKEKKILSNLSSFFVNILSQTSISNDLASFPFIEEAIQRYVIDDPSPEIIQYLQYLIFIEIDPTFFIKIDYKQVTLFLISSMKNPNIRDDIKPHLILFFCTFFQEISKVVKNFTTFVVENDGMKALEKLLDKSNHHSFYSKLILSNNDDKSPPPNALVLKIIYQHFIENENFQKEIFEMLLGIIQSNSDFFTKINSIVPIKQWFNSVNINLNSAIILFTYLKVLIPEDVDIVLRYLFSTFGKQIKTLGLDIYLNFFNLIDDLFTNRLISLKFLISLDFLVIFVLNQTPSQLAQFFIKSPKFTQLTLDIIAYEKDQKIRELLYKSIIITHNYFEDLEVFISLCSAFLIIAPSENDITKTIEEIENNSKYTLINIFIKAFPKSVELTDNFIHLKYHLWISNLFDKKLIDITNLSEFFASLVSQKPYRELDDLITSYKKDHPIFYLDKAQIDRIVYGLKDIRIFPHRPIRVCSLYHLLDCPEQCSPYNAWVLGKYGLSNFDDIEKVPLLPCVANRFMLADDVERVLKYPKMFEKFCDLTYDHFSMFQFYAGTEEMRIDTEFSSLSFWFIFSEELRVDVHLFHTDNLMFDINQESLTIICDGQTVVVDAKPTEWTHVFIRLESSFSSKSVKITLNNDHMNTIYFNVKTKINAFTHACFSAAQGSPMLFLGSAIRFSSIIPRDFSMIYSHGPGYIEPSNDLNETLLVTPFALSKVSVPLNCFPVPYMGFAVHNLSNHNFKVMLRHLRETNDIETYNSVFKAICNINKITLNYNKRFWKQLLHSIKHAKIFPSTELLNSALSTVVDQKQCDKIFGTILYGGNLWDIVDNETLVCSLFDSFPTVNWKNYQDSEIFLINIVEKNPQSSKIINKILVNYRRVPHAFKLLGSLLKAAPITDWNSTHSPQKKPIRQENDCDMLFQRAESQIQFTIIESIINIVDKKNSEIFKQILPFDELKYIFITGSQKFSARVLHLIVIMAAFNTDFIQIDSAFLCKVSSLCNVESVWNDLMFLVSGDPDCNSKIVRRPGMIPLLLHLIWSGGAFLVHCHSNLTLNINFNKIEELLNKSVIYLAQIVPQILLRPDCLEIIINYFPLILNYPVLFQPDFRLPEIKSPTKIPQLSISNLSENDDPMWSHSINRLKSKIIFPDSYPIQNSKRFLANIISEFIKGANINDNRIEHKDITDIKNFEIFIMSSPLFVLLCDFILHSGNLAPSLTLNLFISQPFIDSSRSKIFVKDLTHILLQRTDINTLSSTLQSVFLIAGKKFLNDDSSRIFHDLFVLCQMIANHIEMNELSKYSDLFMQIFLIIFYSVPNEEFASLYEVIKRNITIFAELTKFSKTQKCWIYGFSIAFSQFSGLYDILLQIIKTSNNEHFTKDSLNSTFIEECKADWEMFLTKVLNLYEDAKSKLSPQSTIIFSEASLQFTKRSYIANCKHYLVRKLLNDAYLFIDSTFPIFIEKRKWSNFLVLQQEQRSSKSNFNPKSYHLSPRCAPFYAPKVLTPSQFEPFLGDDFSKSPQIEIFDRFLQLPSPRLDKKTLISLFSAKFKKWGNPVSVNECNILRYADPIPSISFWYPQAIIILTYAKLKNRNSSYNRSIDNLKSSSTEHFFNNNSDIEFIEETNMKKRHIFLEGVFLGHYGITSLFVSHIVMIVPLYSILYVSRHNLSQLAFWTFNSGHFLLEFSEKQIRQVTPFLEKINKTALDSFPLENYLTQSKINHDALTLLNNNRITVHQFMLSLNALSGRSFVDLNNFPFIPRLFNDNNDEASSYNNSNINQERRHSSQYIMDFPGIDVISGLLFRIFPFRYYSTSTSPLNVSLYYDIPLSLLVIPEILIDINNLGVGNCDITTLARSPRHFTAKLREALENNANRETILTWVHTHFSITPTRSSSLDQARWKSLIDNPYDKRSNTSRTSSTTMHSRPGSHLRPIERKLNRQKSTVISVSRRLSQLTFVNNLTDKVLFCEYHHMYGLAESISVSVDGVFFVIDFAFGITRAYKVIFSSGTPTRAKCISEFSAGAKPKSSVSGHDWVCATASGKRLAIWEIITGTVHRLIKFDSLITAVAFDESHYYIWVAVSKKVKIIGINGIILGEQEVPDCITAMMHIDRKKTTFCGTETGRIFMLTFNLTTGLIDIQELESKHKDPIEKIVQQNSIKRYISVDSTGRAEKWNPEGEEIDDEETHVFSSCAICTNPTSTLCQFCNKPICDQCMPKHAKGPNCRHCIAFI